MTIRCAACGHSENYSATPPATCPGCGATLAAEAPSLAPPPIQAMPPRRAPAPASPPVASGHGAPPQAPASVKAGAPAPATVKAPARAAVPAPAAGPSQAPRELSPEQSKRVAEYERLIAANRQAKAPYLQLAKVYQEAGNKEQTAAVYRRYLEVDPANQVVKVQLEQLEGRAPARPATGPSTASLQAERRHAEAVTRRVGIGIAIVGLIVAGFVLRHRLFPSATPVARASYGNTRPFWSPDGRRLAWLAQKGEQGSIGVHDFETGATREIALTSWGMGEMPRWSPDGTDLLVEGMSEGGSDADSYWGPVVRVVNVLDGSSKEVARGSHADWSPDGRSLILLCPPIYPRSEEGQVIPPHMCRVDRLSGAITRIYDRDFSEFALQPGGSLIAFQVDKPVDWDKVAGDLQRAASDSGEVDPTQSLENVVSGSGRVSDLERGKVREIDRLQKEDKKRGRQADGSFWMPEADIWVIGTDGAGLGALTSDGRSVLVGWTPDGQSLLFLHQPDAGARAEVWTMDARGGNRRRVLPPNAEVVDERGVALTPDGRSAIFLGVVPDVNPALLAAMSNSPPFDLYEVPLAGGEPERLANMHSFKSGFALSPDGKRIAYEYVSKDSGQPEIWLMKR